MKKFFRKLRNGEYPLGTMFWIFGLLVMGITGSISTVLRTMHIGTAMLHALVDMTYISYTICWICGLWKSANAYEGEKIWAVLAKIFGIIVFFLAPFILILGIGIVLGILETF